MTLGVAAGTATLTALALLNMLAFVQELRGQSTVMTLVRLGSYLLASILAYRPLIGWATRRGGTH